MASADELIASCRVPESGNVHLKDYDPDWAGDPKLPKEERKEFAEHSLMQDVSALAEAQDRLYTLIPGRSCSSSRPWTPPAKTARSSTSCRASIPRAARSTASSTLRRGTRSQLSLALHPGPARTRPDRHLQPLVLRGSAGCPGSSRAGQRRANTCRPRSTTFWTDRYDDINALERHLTRNGTVVLKFFLHVSKNEQRKRFLKRLDDPGKHWKFSASDLTERASGTTT